MYRYVCLLVIAFLSITAVPAFGQPAPQDPGPRRAGYAAFRPNVLPVLPISRAAGAIQLDGDLGDPGWAGAAVATNFSETFPGDQEKPPIGIDTYLTYDDTNFYLGFDIRDQPGAIRSNLSDRDQIWQDDYVGILLDTNGDGQQVYFIASNPLGIQGDTRISTGGEDVSFDLVYASAGRITETGYQVEIAVPFRSLRFPRAPLQEWRANLWITHPRASRNTYAWAALDRDNPCFSCQMGFLDGIAGVESGKNLEILPSLTGTQSGQLLTSGDPRSGFDNARLQAEPSLNVKYGITSDLTADLTINPDFSQIEADAAQIDVNSTFALSFPERRAFFQEGSDLFETFLPTVYTRSINDPIVANKLTGRFGKVNLAYIGARDNTSPILLPFEESSTLLEGGKSVSNILRLRRSFADNSYFGTLVTDRRLDDGGSGTTVGFDGVWRLWQNYQLEGQFAASYTVEPDAPEMTPGLEGITFGPEAYTAAMDGESLRGHALYTSFERDARHWSFGFDYWQTAPTFRADNGFLNQNDSRQVIASQAYTFYPQQIKPVDRIMPRIHAGRTWNFDAVRKSDWVSPAVTFLLKRQTWVNLSYRASRERFRGIEFTGLRALNFSIESNFSEPVQLGFSVSGGRTIARNLDDPMLGKSFDLGAWGNIRPTQRLKLQPQFSFARLENLETGEAFFSGYILRTRVNYQLTRRLFFRAVVQYNDFAERLEVDPLVTYRINPFSAVHFGSTHDYDTYRFDDRPTVFSESRRQIFFKLQYLFRV